MTSTRQGIRTLLAAVLLCSLGLRAGIRSITDDWRTLATPWRGDFLSQELLRYQPLVSSLPQSGLIGYLAEQRTNAIAAQRFYAAQYALTRRLLVPGSGPTYVIVDPDALIPDAGGRGTESADPRLRSYSLYERFPNGLRVFRRLESVSWPL